MAYKRVSPQPVIEGGTGIQSATAYSPLTGGTTSTGPFQSASSGQSNSGYVLTSTGSSSLPTWQPATGGGGGSLVLIQSQLVNPGGSVASVNFTSGITSTYNTYLFSLSNIVPVNAGDSLYMQVSTNGGSSWITSGYSAGCNYTSSYSSSSLTNVNSTSEFIIAPSNYNINQYGVNGTLYCFDVTNGSDININSLATYTNNSGPGYGGTAFAGGVNTANTINGFKFFMSTGNIGVALISLYGLLE